MRNVALTLVHVLTPQAVTWAYAAVADFRQWQEEVGHQIIAESTKIAEESPSMVAHHRSPARCSLRLRFPTLVDLSKDAEMIVVGSRGRGTFRSGLLGSVSSGLIHHAHCPVAVIHDEHASTPHPVRAPVLVGIDGSPVSEPATAIAFDEASRRGVDLVALHAWSDVGAIELPGFDWATLKAEQDDSLAERLARWQQRYADVTVNPVLVCDQPARQLVEHSATAQLVVVGSRGARRIRRNAAGRCQHRRGTRGPDTSDRRSPQEAVVMAQGGATRIRCSTSCDALPAPGGQFEPESPRNCL